MTNADVVTEVIKNKVDLSGVITVPPTLDHEFNIGNLVVRMMRAVISTERKSGKTDDIILMYDSSKFDLKEGDKVKVTGSYRSFNKITSIKNKLELYVIPKEIKMLEDLDVMDDLEDDPNVIILDGFLCKDPIYRTTPFGRKIADLLIAVNTAPNKSDYIPSIAWGKFAKAVNDLKTGDRIKIKGRIQSRDYVKKINDEYIIERIAYEVSVNKVFDLECEEDMQEF